MNEELACYSSPDPRSWWQRMMDWMFPHTHCFMPDAPGDFKDCLSVTTVTDLSWADRLRVLVSGRVVTNSRTVTENEVGRTVTAAVCYPSLKSRSDY